MRAVDLHLSRAGFGESLGEMRKWLDHNDCTPASFDTAAERSGTVHVHVEFDEDDLAAAFERNFDDAARMIASSEE
jgi:hypothetical protein